MKDERRALVLFSGGQDSTVCLAWALNRFRQVETIGFDYGQRHEVELECRQKVREELRTQFPGGKRLGDDHLLDLALLGQISDTALTQQREIEMTESGLPNTFVPGRNLLFLTFAATVLPAGLNVLVGGMSETDFSGYHRLPRQHPSKALQVALSLGLDAPMTIETPLMWYDKAQTWALTERLGGEALIDPVAEHTHLLRRRPLAPPRGVTAAARPACDLRRAGCNAWMHA